MKDLPVFFLYVLDGDIVDASLVGALAAPFGVKYGGIQNYRCSAFEIWLYFKYHGAKGFAGLVLIIGYVGSHLEKPICSFSC
jgi:hypothetical protein